MEAPDVADVLPHELRAISPEVPAPLHSECSNSQSALTPVVDLPRSFGPLAGHASDQAFGPSPGPSEQLWKLARNAVALAGDAYGLTPLAHELAEGNFIGGAALAVAARSPVGRLTIETAMAQKLPFTNGISTFEYHKNVKKAYQSLLTKMVALRDSKSISADVYQSLFGGLSVIYRASRMRNRGWGELSLKDGLTAKKIASDVRQTLDPLVEAFETAVKSLT